MDKISRILILEDCAADADMVEFELQDAQINFMSKRVIKEEDFLQSLQEFCPDLILSDYELPQYNGSLALAAAKARCPSTPFILVTGAIKANLSSEIINAGASDFVGKSQLDKLVPAVRKVLEEL